MKTDLNINITQVHMYSTGARGLHVIARRTGHVYCKRVVHTISGHLVHTLSVIRVKVAIKRPEKRAAGYGAGVSLCGKTWN